MADVADELAELMPRTVGGRRLSAAAFSSDALKQYQAAVRAQRQARQPRGPCAFRSALRRSAAAAAGAGPSERGADGGVRLGSPPAPGRQRATRRHHRALLRAQALVRGRSAARGGRRAGLCARMRLTRDACPSRVKPATPSPARRTSRPRLSSAAEAETGASAAPAGRSALAASVLEHRDSSEPCPGAAENTPPGPARQSSRRASAAPPSPLAAPSAPSAPPLFEDASPSARAYLLAARQRLGGLQRPQGRPTAALGAPTAAAFSLAYRASAAPAGATPSRSQPASSPAGEQTRRGGLSRWESPGGVAGAPLALTPPPPPPLEPTPEPTPGNTPLPPPPALAGAATQTSPLAEASPEPLPLSPALRLVAHAAAPQVQPIQRHVADMACSPMPAAEAAEAPQFDDGGFDDDAGGGWQSDGAGEEMPPLQGTPVVAATPKPRRTRPAGTPYKRLRAAAMGRKSLAAAGSKLVAEGGGVVRRSARVPLRPLEYWRGETVQYGRAKKDPTATPSRGRTGPSSRVVSVVGVTLRSPEPQWPAPAGWKGPGRGKAAPPPPQDSDLSEEEAPARKAKAARKRGGKKAAPVESEESE